VQRQAPQDRRGVVVQTGRAVTVREVSIYTTCPPSSRYGPGDYAGVVADVSRWSDDAGCTGILVYTDHSLLDSWLVAQMVIGATRSLAPLVAVQPVYMHPYTVAKMVTSLAHLHGRRVDLNFVAGGFRRDLLTFGDELPHDGRYERLAEYASIVQALLTETRPVSFTGRYYAVRDLRLTPPLPPDVLPSLMVSGSSAAGRAVAGALGATAVRYPERITADASPALDAKAVGIRIGIITRPDGDEAWGVAHERFPADRRGQITHALALRTSDSRWHRQLADEAPDAPGDDPYWLHPFRNYQTFCPYVVGSYERVAKEVRRYLDRGVATVILDVPWSPDDLEHVRAMLALAGAAVPAPDGRRGAHSVRDGPFAIRGS
jgi:alkanesulfonate monooxygenase